MDRHVGRGTLGLTTRWLEVGQTCSYEEHQLQKEIISAEGAWMERKEARARLQGIADAGDEDITELIAMEAQARDSGDEPFAIPCRSLVGAAASSHGTAALED